MKKFEFIFKLFLLCLALISFFGGVVYRVYALNNLGITIALILVIVSLLIILRSKHKFNKNYKKVLILEKKPSKKTQYINSKSALFLFFYFFNALICFYILICHRMTEAIISPWQILPNYFFIFYFLATIILFLIIYKREPLSLILIIFHAFLSFSVVLIVYSIGYGFDPFIHKATLELIAEQGAVFPKPLYYLGQYSLVIIIHKLSFIPIAILDLYLVPVLAAITLPISIFLFLDKWFESRRVNFLLLLVLLIFPFSFLIVTTPQNLSYIFLLLIIFLGLSRRAVFDLVLLIFLGLSALITQPIAGIPALFLAGFISVSKTKKQIIKKYLFATGLILLTVALPISFLMFIGKDGLLLELPNKLNFAWLKFPNEENLILNLIYFYYFNLKYLIFSLVGAGIFIAIKNKARCQPLFLYLYLSLAMFISYVLTKLLSFNFLIDYEQNDYSDRILLVSGLFLLPFIILALYNFINKLIKQNLFIKIIIFLFIGFLITASLYFSYPRFDNFHNSHGYSVSASDLKTVNWIEENHKEDYIVLSNQQVSVAALKEFGFKKYYELSPIFLDEMGEDYKTKEIFYYPIPTASPLYNHYLDMVYESADRATVVDAMKLAQVNEAYFVLNKYWWAFDKILNEAKLSAESWQEIDSGEIYIFKYIR